MRWFRSLNNQEDKYSLMNTIHLNNKNCIICSETDIRQFTYFRTCFEFFNYAKNIKFENNCFYEVIRGNLPQKPYFDIDISLKDDTDNINEENYLSKEEKINIGNKLIICIVNAIKKIHHQILDEHILIFNSHGETKRSYHIIVDYWCFPTYKQNKQFYNQVLEFVPKTWQKFCDASIYKSIQQFRTYLSHKWNTNRIKLIDPLCKWKSPNNYVVNCNDVISHDKENMFLFINSLINNTDYCSFLPYIVCDEIESFSQELDDIDINLLKKVINSMEDISSFKIGKISNSVVSLFRIKPSFCESCNKIHDNENPFVFVNMNNDVYFNCRRGGSSKKIGSLSFFGIKDLKDSTTEKSGGELEEKSLKTMCHSYFISFEQKMADVKNDDKNDDKISCEIVKETKSPKSIVFVDEIEKDFKNNISKISIIEKIRNKKKKDESNKDIFFKLLKI